MKIEAIEPHGFCSGVKAALEKALHALARCAGPGTVCCLHEIVHNESVVADLRAKGLRFVDRLEDVPAGGTVLFSAHGVGPGVRRLAQARGLEVVDATCPFVARVHRQVRDDASRGASVVVVGHAEHVEVLGVVDEARDAGADVAVVKGVADVAALPFPGDAPVGVVCQTTLSADGIAPVLAALRARYPRLAATPAADACTATRDRQEAVRSFVAGGGDAVLVLGSATSSNTRRLAETAEAAGARAWRAADLAEVAAIDFSGVSRLGVTSGASTPEAFFERARAYLETREREGVRDEDLG